MLERACRWFDRTILELGREFRLTERELGDGGGDDRLVAGVLFPDYSVNTGSDPEAAGFSARAYFFALG